MRVKFRKYLVGALLFLAIMGTASLTYKLLDGYLLAEINSSIHRLILLLASVLLIPYFSKPTKPTNTIKNLMGRDYTLMISVVSLFIINNLLAQQFGTSFAYTAALGLTFVQITISSISEEFLYRGLLQSYIDQNNKNNHYKISPGNYFATTLMVLTHLGFFLVMSPLFALSSLLLVAGFSLAAGYLKAKTNGLFVPIVMHLTVNYLHLLIQSLHL